MKRFWKTLLAGPKSSKDLDEKGLADLKSRGLVESSKTKEWRYEITDSGRQQSSFWRWDQSAVECHNQHHLRDDKNRRMGREQMACR